MRQTIELETDDIELILNNLKTVSRRYQLAVESIERDLAAESRTGPVDSETQRITEEYIKEIRNKRVRTEIIINTIESQL